MINLRFPGLANRRLIFCINSGRSGSKYLAELLATARHVQSFHEPEPKMNGVMTRLINELPYDESWTQRQVKADAIAEALQSLAASDIYVETSHMFIKTFFDVVLADFPQLEVIILRRYLPQVLKSFVEMGYFSALNPRALDWMSSPNAVTAALPALAPDGELNPWDAAMAYLLDIEARAQRFLRDYPRIHAHEVRLEQITQPADIAALFERLNLEPTQETWDFAGRKVNDRPQRKQQLNNPTTIEECRARFDDYLRRAQAQGLPIPATAALTGR